MAGSWSADSKRSLLSSRCYPLESSKNICSDEAGPVTEGVLYTDNLVPLGGAFAAREGSHFQLSGIGSNGEMADKSVFRFSRARTHNGQPSRFLRQADRCNGLCHCANLIRLNEDGIGDPSVDASLDERCIRTEQIIANELNLVSERASDSGPSFPVTLSHWIFQRNDGILRTPVHHQVDELF